MAVVPQSGLNTDSSGYRISIGDGYIVVSPEVNLRSFGNFHKDSCGCG